ncbi:hypothetical protein BDW59DRAFT_167024 [Aspergillus cavernicola]|uniref:Uncharacterized protein n=1 Tax=Aspergillus cavernicola TaxID=176166 RepID=A0ABR4HHC2_9EURO
MASSTTPQLDGGGDSVAINRLLLAELHKLNGLLSQMQSGKCLTTKAANHDDDDRTSDSEDRIEDLDEATDDDIARVLPYIAMSPSDLTVWAVHALKELDFWGLAGPRPRVHFVTSRGESRDMNWQEFYQPPERLKLDVQEQWDCMFAARLGLRRSEWELTQGEAGSGNEDRIAFWWHASTLFRDPNIRYHLQSWVYDDHGFLKQVTSYLEPGSICFDLKKRLWGYQGKLDWVYGREWTVNFGDNCIVPWDVVLFILVQTLAFPTVLNIHGAALLVLSYAMPWEDLSLTSPYHYTDSDLWMEQFHIRCLRVIPSHYECSGNNKANGINLARAFWEEKTTFLNPQRRLRLREIRMSAAIRAQRGRIRPYFTTIKLTDGIYDDWDNDPPITLKGDSVFPDGPVAPVDTFQNMISRMLEKWACCWRGVLDELDQVVSVKVRVVWILAMITYLPRATELTRGFGVGQAEEALTKEWVEDHMFDDSFQMTARYFSVLQLLRIIPTWIDNSSNDVDSLCDCRSVNGVMKNMETLRGQKNKLVDELKTRIEQKVDEIESLRDGIFNATSLKEASTSRVMSSYLFIFTIMTIFYLPLSFVVSLFGMHLFDYSDVSTTQASFYITIVLAALMTYVAALVAVWGVAPKEQRDALWKQLSARMRTSRLKKAESEEQGRKREKEVEGRDREEERRWGKRDERGNRKEMDAV